MTAAAAAGEGLRGHISAHRRQRGSSRACISKATSVIVWWFERLAAHSSCCSASSLPVLRAKGPQYEDPLTLKAEGRVITSLARRVGRKGTVTR
ncbi:hypothetical protein E2C01_072896 [Portunus trituberculatus]|uniref:Uncharacterized protein n=1 Tax=Portunus trituberculatus TaxID=210409 RepID=A0A5B7I1B1_PORTR|nr:hypothetical protein [Portunus trituberculatus]